MKTAELIGSALDWAVAKCEGHDARVYGGVVYTTMHQRLGPECHYSTDWFQGGPIVERERISVWARSNEWAAESFVCNQEGHEQTGPTPLIAAMRCYVASKLGDTVDIPEELT